jgi:FixJ family two-component response regulator
MKSGAVEFLIKPFSCDALLNAMRNAIALSHAELGREAEQEALLDHYALLSRREREVMALVVRGRLNKQVGGELGISEITVKAHRGKVMRKMRANSFVDLVNMASKLNNIHDPNIHDPNRQRRVLQTVLPWLRNTGARGVGANELDC